jgi:hypothetical protein
MKNDEKQSDDSLIHESEIGDYSICEKWIDEIKNDEKQSDDFLICEK